MFQPIDKRNETAAELLRRGHAERLMISQDFCASIDWFPAEAAPNFEAAGAIRNWSMTLVFDEVVPALRELGVMDDAVFDTIFVQNPARWLTSGITELRSARLPGPDRVRHWSKSLSRRTAIRLHLESLILSRRSKEAWLLNRRTT